MSVLKLYRSPSGFAIVPVHYSHDPNKNRPEWMLKQRAKYDTPEKWQREMEIDFSAHVGTPCYPDFVRGRHLVAALAYQPSRPLDLFCDFNYAPMCWGVAQVINGWVNVLKTWEVISGTTEKLVALFREEYPEHAAGVRVYGDASGHSHGHQGAKEPRTDYQIMDLEFRGYPSALEFKVPRVNPGVRNRVNAVNRKLRAADGAPGVRIDAVACPGLVLDMTDVVWKPDGKEILKVNYDPNDLDPYAQRTHISDAFGYFIAREWPVSSEKDRLMPMSSRRPKPKRPKTGPIGAFR